MIQITLTAEEARIIKKCLEGTLTLSAGDSRLDDERAIMARLVDRIDVELKHGPMRGRR